MRLVVWNCRMALQKPAKWSALTALHPDVAVVPECADPASVSPVSLEGASSHVWVGPNRKKGLGAFSFGSYQVEGLPRSSEERADAVAMRVNGPTSFTLIAVWARAPKYVQNLHDVLDQYAPLLRAGDVVMAGDFNSNSVWDRLHGKKCHSKLVERLDGFGMVSAYHLSRGEAHGAEREKTFFQYAKRGAEYHIDYVFFPRAWRSRLRECSVGSADRWLSVSDHCPVSVDLAA